jgi:hypothetical protein
LTNRPKYVTKTLNKINTKMELCCDLLISYTYLPTYQPIHPPTYLHTYLYIYKHKGDGTSKDFTEYFRSTYIKVPNLSCGLPFVRIAEETFVTFQIFKKWEVKNCYTWTVANTKTRFQSRLTLWTCAKMGKCINVFGDRLAFNDYI